MSWYSAGHGGLPHDLHVLALWLDRDFREPLGFENQILASMEVPCREDRVSGGKMRLVSLGLGSLEGFLVSVRLGRDVADLRQV